MQKTQSLHKKTKESFVEDLKNYKPTNKKEEEHQNTILKFLNEKDNNFDRGNLEGHITGSSWLVNRNKTKTLLTHHRKLNKWLQLGGHADGSPDVLDVAIREAQEESGIEEIKPLYSTIFDIDVHLIPDRTTKGEPEHYHYDIRYLLYTDNENFQISKESINLKWICIKEIDDFSTPPSLDRMIKKWKNLVSDS